MGFSVKLYPKILGLAITHNLKIIFIILIIKLNFGNPQCFKEKKYIVKFSISSIFKKISKDNFEKKEKKLKKKTQFWVKKKEKKHVKKMKKKQKWEKKSFRKKNKKKLLQKRKKIL